jgi:tetratricopeptide (TPR) repeat protein
VRGVPDSLRYAAQGSTVFHLKQGEHIIVVGARDRVAEREISVTKLDPMPLSIDLATEAGLLFHSCPDAVASYLEGRLDAAAQTLEAHGQADTARRARATWHQQRGELAEAAREFEALGDLSQAAELCASSADVGESARLFEQAGEHGRAADVYRESGDLENAARAYEVAYDYENAIDCYRQLGNTEKLIELLESSGDYFEAGVAAAEAGQPDRAISNLQQVESRHERYTDCCRMLGEMLLNHGDTDFAVEKFDELKSQGGLGDLPLELQERYAKLLEESGRAQDALEILEAIRRKDVHYGDVSTRIEELKRQLSPPAAGPGESVALGAGSQVQESRYEIIEELGRGAMGVVYRARDKHLGRVVALKQLPPNLKDHPSAVHFFEREARSAAVLNHPNIVTIFDAGQENGTYFITMECLEGIPLDAIMKKHKRLASRAVAKLGIQIATGLDYAHRNKIIHRDIKTANLFFTKEKVVKIMDFGLAKMVEEVRRAATVIGGTPYYMAPEQAEGVGVDHRADLYALGVTFFQLATGSYPFDKGDVLYHHKHTEPPDPREFAADIPEELAKLILKLMAKRPEDRIQTAAEVVEVLQRISQGL